MQLFKALKVISKVEGITSKSVILVSQWRPTTIGILTDPSKLGGRKKNCPKLKLHFPEELLSITSLLIAPLPK